MGLLPPGMMTVEAMQFDLTNGDAIGLWIAGKGKPAKVHVQGDGDPEPSYVEFPLKDAKPGSPLWHCRAQVGQWILYGPRGFERWSAEQFERVFHRITVAGQSVTLPASIGNENVAERLAREIVEQGADRAGV